jgi:hypothetical protein
MMRKFYMKYFANDFIKVLLTFVLFTAYSLPLNATIRYVSKTGLSIPPYTSWETAADSIQKCINICVFGDTIYVANGIYEEQVVMINGLSLIGSGTDSCEINTQPFATTTSYRSVIVKDTCLFKGFKIVVANNSEIGGGVGGPTINSLITLNRITKAKYGIENGSNAVIYNNIIDNISTGMDIFNSNALVRDNTICTDPNSQSTIVAGMQITAFNNNYKPILDSNYIVANIRAEGIRQSTGSRAVIKNNNILLRSVLTAIFLGSSDSVKVYNNRIYAESGARGIYNNVVQYLQVYNNYITGNIGDGIRFGSPYNTGKNNVISNANRGIIAGGDFVFQYNNLWENDINYVGFTPDTTNLSVDPMVVNNNSTQGELDFHLQMFSPLIDAGDPNILDKDSSRSDIGLYGGPYGESYIYIDLPPRSPVNLTATVDSNIVTIKWNKNTEADFNYYKLFYDTTNNFTIDSTKLVTSQPDTFYYFVIPTGVESLYFKLTAVDNQGNESNPSEEVAVILVSVKNEWKPVNNYILYQNYPNPFNPSTKIGYKLKERGYVKLYVYDIKGELVSVLVNQTQDAGYYEVVFDTGSPIPDSGIRNLASGVYIYQIFVKGENNIPAFSDIKKMMYIK